MYSHNFIYLAYTLINLASTDIACSPYLSPQLNVTYENQRSVINHKLETKEIEEMVKSRATNGSLEHYYNSHFKDSTVPGVTLMKLNTDITVNTKHSFQEKHNMGCLYIEDIHINLGMKQTIFISKQYPKNSCYYDAVLTHEQKHLTANRSITRRYDIALKEAVQSQIDFYLQNLGTGPFYNSDIQKFRKEIVSIISGFVSDAQKPLSDEINRIHKNIDTVKEYDDVSKRCNEWPVDKITMSPKSQTLYND